jgi:bacterioferritin-associated ferredoxin
VNLKQIEQHYKECGSMQQALTDLQVGTKCGTCLTRLDLLKTIEEDASNGPIAQLVRAADS